MTHLDPSEANLVADVLSRHWRVKEPAIRTPLGVSRATWRVGKLYWLAQAEHVRLGELSPQATLLTYLNQYLKVERISLSVPEIIASRAGDLLVDDFGYVWCLTRHLPGFHPAVGDPGPPTAVFRGSGSMTMLTSTVASTMSPETCVPSGRSTSAEAEEAFSGGPARTSASQFLILASGVHPSSCRPASLST